MLYVLFSNAFCTAVGYTVVGVSGTEVLISFFHPADHVIGTVKNILTKNHVLVS